MYGETKEKKRQAREKIRKVLLLSPSAAQGANQAAESRQEENPQLSFQNQHALTAVSEAEVSLRDQSGAAVFGKEGWERIKDKDKMDTPAASPTVADLLKIQAAQVLQAGNEGQALLDSQQVSSENTAETAEVLPPGQTIRLSDLGEDAQRTVDRALALTQQAAQRDLATLVEGLAGATNAVANSLANQETNSR
jgi:ATP-dependent protease HslVU (ClpYQ) ATPase subunit